jgi:hypothetical protein
MLNSCRKWFGRRQQQIVPVDDPDHPVWTLDERIERRFATVPRQLVLAEPKGDPNNTDQQNKGEPAGNNDEAASHDSRHALFQFSLKFN